MPTVSGTDIFLAPGDEMRRALKEDRCRRSLYEFVREFWIVLEPGTPFIDSWHVEAICRHLQAVSDGTFSNLIICIPPGFAKPLGVDSLVLMQSGKRKKLGDISVGEYVISHTGNPCLVSAVHEQGDLPCLKIATLNGREIISAKDHPFLTPEGWVNAENLVVGQSLGCGHHPKIKSSNIRKDDEFTLAGYFVGDGSVSSNNANITSKDADYIEEVCLCCDRLGYKYIIRVDNNGVSRIGISGGVRDWLKSIGLAGHTSATKRIPEFVFSGSEKQISKFISAYFHCDGTIGKKSKDRKRFVVSFSSISIGLLKDLQHLMLRLGISAKLRTRYSKVHRVFSGQIENYTYYVLDIYREDEASRFLTTIPIFGRKRDLLGSYKPLRRVFDSEYISDEIISIEDFGGSRCRCLTVDGDSTFTANDFVVHNSTITSVLWFCWMWINHPGIKVLYGSYDEDLTFRDSDKCRDLIRSKEYQDLFEPEWKIKGSIDKKSLFANTFQGNRKTYYMTSRKKTGWRGEFLVADDPLSSEDRYDKNIKTQVNDTWDVTLPSRLNSAGHNARVIIMQRLADDDLVGHVIERYGNTYVLLILANEFDPDRRCITYYPDGREFFRDPREELGELLCSRIVSEQKTEDLKIALGPVEYSAQYMHRPVPIGGDRFKSDHFQYWGNTTSPYLIELRHRNGQKEYIRIDRVQRFLTADVAADEKKKADYTCIGIFAITDKNELILLHRVKQQTNEYDTIQTMLQLYNMQQWGRVLPSFVGIEDNGLGLPISQNAKAAGLPVKQINVHKDKVVLSATATTRIQGGQIFFPDYDVAPWMHDFVAELLAFPAGKNDDQVSMLSLAANSVFEQAVTSPRTVTTLVDKGKPASFNPLQTSTNLGRTGYLGVGTNGSGHDDGHGNSNGHEVGRRRHT